MLLFEGRGIEVENPTFAFGERSIRNIEVLLKFSMPGWLQDWPNGESAQ